MSKLQLLIYSYSSRLQAYWNSLSIRRQRVLLLIAFTLYMLICLLTIKTSFVLNAMTSSEEKLSNLKAVKYLLTKQKVESQSTIKTQNYEPQSIR